MVILSCLAKMNQNLNPRKETIQFSTELFFSWGSNFDFSMLGNSNCYMSLKCVKKMIALRAVDVYQFLLKAYCCNVYCDVKLSPLHPTIVLKTPLQKWVIPPFVMSSTLLSIYRVFEKNQRKVSNLGKLIRINFLVTIQ